MLTQATLALGLLGAAAVSASPIVNERAPACKLIADSPLGYNVSGIGA